ncbi:MAG: hypothetical protein JW944_13760 [Deltaproteobacteria bacterium]|nr:hypothetical protein [Deltaproteobacteria bacterium]
MARKKRAKGKEEIADEKEDSTDSSEEETGQDTSNESQEDVSEPEEKPAAPGTSLIRRWWIPGLLIFIFIAAGTAAILKPDLLDAIKGEKKPDYSIDLSNNNLQEDDLSPFFIPAQEGSSRGAVRVDLSVIWDGVASVRYKTNELKVRAAVYEYLTDIDRSIADTEDLKMIIEYGINNIFRESLGAKDLAVRIKEIKVI